MNGWLTPLTMRILDAYAASSPVSLVGWSAVMPAWVNAPGVVGQNISGSVEPPIAMPAWTTPFPLTTTATNGERTVAVCARAQRGTSPSSSGSPRVTPPKPRRKCRRCIVRSLGVVMSVHLGRAREKRVVRRDGQDQILFGQSIAQRFLGEILDRRRVRSEKRAAGYVDDRTGVKVARPVFHVALVGLLALGELTFEVDCVVEAFGWVAGVENVGIGGIHRLPLIGRAISADRVVVLEGGARRVQNRRVARFGTRAFPRETVDPNPVRQVGCRDRQGFRER